MRHKAVQDVEAELLTNVCKDIVIEPMLQPTSGADTLPHSNSEENGARCKGLSSTYR